MSGIATAIRVLPPPEVIKLHRPLAREAARTSSWPSFRNGAEETGRIPHGEVYFPRTPGGESETFHDWAAVYHTLVAGLNRLYLGPKTTVKYHYQPNAVTRFSNRT